MGTTSETFQNWRLFLRTTHPDYNIHLVYGEPPEDEPEEEWIKIAIDL
jgi:hypothetical protein